MKSKPLVKDSSYLRKDYIDVKLKDKYLKSLMEAQTQARVWIVLRSAEHNIRLSNEDLGVIRNKAFEKREALSTVE